MKTIGILFLTFFAFFYAVNARGTYVVTWEDPEEAVTEKPHLLGEKECTYGPSYWCFNITQAKQCSAVKHCTKVWETKEYPEDNDSVCQVCKNMVKQARDQLLSNETQEELYEVLEGSCALIPIKIIAKECKKLVDEFIPELVDTLASRMDPNTVCTVSGLCNSPRIDKILEEFENAKADFDLTKDSCPKCNYYVGKAVTFLKSLSKETLLYNLMDVCGHTGSYSDGCRAEISENIEAIYEHIQNKMNAEDLCELAGLCSADTDSQLHSITIGSSNSVRVWKPPTKNGISDDDLACDFCKQLVEYLKKWFVSNTTKREFQQIIQGLCKQTGSFQKECLKLADEYSEMAYDWITTELNPAEDCGIMGICQSNSTFKLFAEKTPIFTILASSNSKVSPLPMMELEKGERFTGDDEKNALSPKTKDPKPYCAFCEYAMHELQVYLQTPATDDEIKQAIDKLCEKILPGEMADECVKFVNTFGDQLIDLLSQEVDPSTVCPMLGACPKDEELTQIAYTDLPTCPLCHIAVSKLIHYIGGNNTAEYIEEAMDKVCISLPKSLHTKCDNFMKNYGDRIAEMLVYEFTSHEVCAALHLCIFGQTQKKETNSIDSDSEEVVPPSQVKIIVDEPLPISRYMPLTIVNKEIEKLKNTHPKIFARDEYNKNEESSTCQVCELVVIQLDNMLKNNATEEEIKEALETVCHKLPKRWGDRCDDMVTTYGDMIIQYLVQEMEPHQVCIEIGLCSDTKAPKIKPMNESKKCVICEFVMSELDKTLLNKKTEEEIRDEVEKICDYLPKTINKRCQKFIKTYGDEIITYLVSSVDPHQVCTQLRLCDVTPKKTKELASSESLSSSEESKSDDDDLIITHETVKRIRMNRCQLCMVISDYLSLMLEDKHVVKDIDSVVEKICPLFPKRYQNECKTMIESYGPIIISLLAQETDRGQVCNQVKVCPDSTLI